MDHMTRKMNGLVPFVVLPLLALVHSGHSGGPTLWNHTVVDKLKHDLLAHYDKFSRPAHHTNTTVVTIDLNLKHIDLDEASSIMTVYAWAKMLWNDEKLQWNKSDYNNIETLHLADHEVWQPDITLYNSAQGSEVDHYGNAHCIVHHDGQVLWVPPAEFRSFCQIDLYYWPFDVQNCFITLGSWAYDGEQIDLQLEEGDTELDMLNNSQWEVIDTQKQRNVKYYPCCTEPYIDVTYTLTLRRRSEAYRTVVITPATVVILLTLATFMLPSHAGEKIILNGLTAVIICIMLLSFSERLPAMAYRPPLIISFYGWSLTLVAFALIESVLVVRISRNYGAHPLPWFLKQALSGWMGKVLLLGPLPSVMQPTGSIGEEMKDQDDDQHEHIIIGRRDSTVGLSHRDWLLFAAAIDRFCFLLYLIIFFLLVVSYHV